MPATTALIPAGRAFPRKPKPVRLSTIWHIPLDGPHDETIAWVIEPRPVPRMIAATLCQNVRPKKSTPRIPTPIVANSRFGEIQVQNICRGTP